jgi:SAM-dependent methyltransferase
MNKLKEIVRRNEFNPGIIGLVTNPFFIARRGLASGIKEMGKQITGKTLDIGCGTKPYENFFNYTEYAGLEYDTGIDQDKKTADYYYSGDRFPFADKTFDSAVCNQVLEHIFNPEIFLGEVNRILRTGGKLLITVPFVWDEHEQPFDYARYSSFGLNHLLLKKGLKVLTQKKITQDFRVIIQLVNGYLYKVTRNIPILKQLIQLVVIFPITLFGLVISFILPKNHDLYLDNIILCEKTEDIE